MSSSGSHEEAAAALGALAWIDDDEAAALAAIFGAGSGEGECCAPGAPRPDSPASPEGSEGNSSGRGSACTVPRAVVVNSAVVVGARAGAAKLHARLDGLRWLDPDCARGCDLCAPNARASRALAPRAAAFWRALVGPASAAQVAARLTRAGAAPRRCIAAPPATSEGSYQLVGDLGKARRRAAGTRA